MKRTFNMFRLGLTVFIVVFGLFANLGIAAAGSNDHSYDTNNDLVHAYEWRVEYQAAIQERLVMADAYDAAVNAVIVELRAKGNDTALLEKGLANFRYRISSIRGEWDKAGVLLKEHKGFDADGQVIDKDMARQTIYDVRHCHRMIVEMGSNVYRQMHDVFHDYGKTHPNVNYVEPKRPTNNSLIS